MPSDQSHKYITDKKIPELFQSLTIALLYHRPEDHVDYLLRCLDDVKRDGWDKVMWDTFLPREHPGSSRLFQAANLPPVNGTLVSGPSN